ncbi:MAG: selenocysteine-specific translation elongation factor [Actinobacteria bacterium]|nr:MAG: selenocysteine-specific translation elongation factor [Actinomycetota bacterium]
MGGGGAPLTVGTAGHIDHGKTTLVRELTGVDTDRLPEEQRRGMTIELGYAPLVLPSGRRLSVIDVPGHEKLVRTMVAGATGIDLFLLVIAADDGVMPQTREHLAVLRSLGVGSGVVAITKADLADPAAAIDEARELVPEAEVVSGAGDVAAALDRVAGELRSRADDDDAALLHVDRSFTIHGAGRVVTGTLWSGSIGRGDELLVLPAGKRARVREVQVHDERVERAAAGQRVAVNLRDANPVRGDVLSAEPLEPTHILDVELDTRLEHGTRVHVHHGTRETPARVAWLGGHFHQLRCEEPLVARRDDRLVVRSISPADTLGGGRILDPHARRHGPSTDVTVRLTRLARGDDVRMGGLTPHSHVRLGGQTPDSQALPPEADDLLERLKAFGLEPPPDDQFDKDEQQLLAQLRHAGKAERVGPFTFHPDALAGVRERVVAIMRDEGSITLARLRDELHTSRRYAQALLEHLDAQRVTRRIGDERVPGSRS